MKEGRYTAREIEDMRGHVWSMLAGISLGSAPDQEQVERVLLTHMKNGTKPHELKKLAEEKQQANRETIKRMEADGTWPPKRFW